MSSTSSSTQIAPMAPPPGAPPTSTIPVVVTQTSYSSPSSEKSSSPPPEVHTDSDSGVEGKSLEIAKLFMGKLGKLARNCRTRGALSDLFLNPELIGLWASPEFVADQSQQRHFKQVLFAMAHGLKLVRVQKGHDLIWNRYRDDQGNQIQGERNKWADRQTRPQSSQGRDQGRDQGRGGSQGDQRDQGRGGYQGDRRDQGRGGYQGDQQVQGPSYQGDRPEERGPSYHKDRREERGQGPSYQGERHTGRRDDGYAR